MKILGNQNSFQQKTFFTDDSQPSKNGQDQNIRKTHQDNSQLIKKRSITTKSKRSLGYNSGVQEFKQNQLKEKVFKQLQQLDKLNSNMNLLITPFSLNNKNIDDSPVFVKTQNKNHHSEASHVAKRFTPYNELKEQSNTEIQKVLENKLSNFAQNKTQNKRKSVSYRIHIPPKQFNCNQESKRNINQLPPEIEKYDHRRRADNQTQIEKRIPLINKQKSSQSFIIRKKFSSNNIDVQKFEEDKPSNRFTYVMQKYRKDRFVKEENVNDLVEMTNQQIIQKLQSSSSPKNCFSPFGGRTKEIKRNVRKQAKKEHHLKGGKSLKVRVNKLIKAQENFFNEKISGQSRMKQNSQTKQKKLKTEQTQPKNQKVRYCTQEQIQLQVLQKPVKIAQKPLKIEENTFENFKEDNSIIIDETDLKKQKNESSFQVIKSSSNVDSQNKIIILSNNKLNVKQQREAENNSNIKNRKSRISSIRAIKNYYKKLDNQEKSYATQERQSKEPGAAKKKDKQPSCLTHKIKWGNISKKKLNSDRVFDVSINPFMNQCSVDGKMKVQKKVYEKQSRISQDDDEQKNTIDAQLNDPKTKKKPFMRAQFIEDQRQTAKVGESDEAIPQMKQKNNNKNLEKMFAQTLKSKQFIEEGFALQQPGSKSLIIFQDPGISFIANNNNSIHIADTALVLPSMERLSIKALEMIDKDMISPVAVMKRRKQDGGEQKIGSLQELYYELKSHKYIPSKVIQEVKIDSLEDLFQKQKA